MEPDFLLRGLLIGLAIAAPVGPIGVLCIRRTLTEGRISGFVSGLGAATADALYGAVAALGLTFITGFMLSQEGWFRLVGGVFLLYLGARTLSSRPAEEAAAAGGRGLVAAYLSTLVLTLTNPLTILSFAAIFAGLGAGSLGTGGNYGAALTLVAGVFLGSALWWFLLSGGVSLFRARLDNRALRWVNVVSGALIVGFGTFALLGLVT
jgi:threonine/homoserine/homoserine lactone efflux protein